MNRLSKHTQIYSDIDIDFTKHPYTKDLAKVTDENSVKQSFLGLLQTNHGERPFQPWLASGVNELLFDNMDPATAIMLEYKIEDLITNYEPRIVLHEVNATPNYDDNAYDVTIGFSIRGVPSKKEMSLQLERIR
jgi:phage baseplate assembly protein W